MLFVLQYHKTKPQQSKNDEESNNSQSTDTQKSDDSISDLSEKMGSSWNSENKVLISVKKQGDEKSIRFYLF